MIHDYIVNFSGGAVVSDDVRYLVGMFCFMFMIEGICSIVKTIIERTAHL